MMVDRTVDQVVTDFMALPAEDREAVAHVVDRLAAQAPKGTAESRALMVEAARETGNANLIRAAEKIAGRAS